MNITSDLGAYADIKCILLYTCMYIEVILKKKVALPSTMFLKVTRLYFQAVLMNLPHFKMENNVSELLRNLSY